MVEARCMTKDRLVEFTSWMSSKNWASRKLKKTGKAQAIYYVMKGKARVYKHMPYSTWKMMKPGTLGYVVQRPDPMFDCLFKKGGGIV